MADSSKLKEMVVLFIRGVWDFEQFSHEYYNYYLQLPSEPGTTAEEKQLFSRVHEQLDWTTSDPEPADRADGWRSVAEFRDWLKKSYEAIFGSLGAY